MDWKPRLAQLVSPLRVSRGPSAGAGWPGSGKDLLELHGSSCRFLNSKPNSTTCLMLAECSDAEPSPWRTSCNFFVHFQRHRWSAPPPVLFKGQLNIPVSGTVVPCSSAPSSRFLPRGLHVAPASLGQQVGVQSFAPAPPLLLWLHGAHPHQLSKVCQLEFSLYLQSPFTAASGSVSDGTTRLNPGAESCLPHRGGWAGETLGGSTEAGSSHGHLQLSLKQESRL